MIDHVVFIPGIVGSELWDGERLVWPGTALEKVNQSYPEDLVNTLATSNTLRVGKILDKVSLFGLGIDHFATGYDKALSLLKTVGFDADAGTLTPFPYDWRRDIRKTAQLFHDRLSGAELQGRRIGIVAHSMGGLVARYAMEKLPALPNVELLILAAVPHHGAPIAFENLIGARPEIFLTGAQCKRVVNNPNFPAAYQLLPHPATKSFFDAAVGGMKSVDLYDPNVYLPLGLLGAGMETARDTWADLPPLNLGASTPVPYFVVAGNAGVTAVGIYLPRSGQGSVVIETTAAGDGTVPIWSAAPASLPCRFVPCDHLGVFEDGQMHRLLQGLLKPVAGNLPMAMGLNTVGAVRTLSAGLNIVGGPASPRLSIQVAQRSVEAGPHGAVIASLVLLDAPQPALSGTLSVTLTTADGTVPQPPVPISYAGAPIRKLDLLVPAPKPGLLTIDFSGPGFPTDAERPATVLVLPASD